MPEQVFRYTGFNAAGSPVSGVVRSADLNAARDWLASQEIYPESLAAQRTGRSLLSLRLRQRKFGLADIEQLVAELALLLRSGVTLDHALRLLADNRAADELGEALAAVHRSVRGGERFSTALDEHFPVLQLGHRRLVRSGEEAGQLPDMLDAIAEDLARQRATRSQLRQALAYPIILGVVSLLSIVFVLSFVVPRLATIFTDPALLPWYTRVLIALSNFVQAVQLPWVLLGLIAVTGGLLLGGHHLGQRLRTMLFKLPIVGSISDLSDRAAFFGSCGVLLRSGIPADQALRLAQDTISRPLFRDEVGRAGAAIKQGRSLTESLSSTTLVTDLERSMLSAGETAGEIGQVFAELAERNRIALDKRIAAAVTVLEPALIVFTGVVVGAIVVVMMLSVMSVNEVPL